MSALPVLSSEGFAAYPGKCKWRIAGVQALVCVLEGAAGDGNWVGHAVDSLLGMRTLTMVDTCILTE